MMLKPSPNGHLISISRLELHCRVYSPFHCESAFKFLAPASGPHSRCLPLHGLDFSRHLHRTFSPPLRSETPDGSAEVQDPIIMDVMLPPGTRPSVVRTTFPIFNRRKFMIFVLFAVLAVTIDVGTNNEQLLKDEFYIGLKQRRAIKVFDGFILHFPIFDSSFVFLARLQTFMV
ncbi:hypothetical protein AAG906_006159 [Vitis piasezkii]